MQPKDLSLRRDNLANNTREVKHSKQIRPVMYIFLVFCIFKRRTEIFSFATKFPDKFAVRTHGKRTQNGLTESTSELSVEVALSAGRSVTTCVAARIVIFMATSHQRNLVIDQASLEDEDLKHHVWSPVQNGRPQGRVRGQVGGPGGGGGVLDDDDDTQLHGSTRPQQPTALGVITQESFTLRAENNTCTG